MGFARNSAQSAVLYSGELIRIYLSGFNFKADCIAKRRRFPQPTMTPNQNDTYYRIVRLNPIQSVLRLNPLKRIGIGSSVYGNIRLAGRS